MYEHIVCHVVTQRDCPDKSTRDQQKVHPLTKTTFLGGIYLLCVKHYTPDHVVPLHTHTGGPVCGSHVRRRRMLRFFHRPLPCRNIYDLHPSQGNSMTTGCPKISHKCNNNNMEKIGDSSSTTKDLLESPNVD